MYVLVLESSTTSAKAMLVNTADGSRETETKAYPAYYADPSLHDAERVFLETAAAGARLCAGRQIDIIALSGVFHSVMLCDDDFTPKTPIYQWSNTEAAGICKKLRADEAYTRNFYQKTGCMVNAIYPAFKLKMLRERGYRLEDCMIAGQGTYNNFRLTGERIVTDCTASGSGLFNIREKRYDKDILSELGLSESNLARLVAYNDSYPLSESGAKLLGLDPGIPVMPCCPDGALNQVGSGALGEGVMTLSVGTSGALRLAVPKPVLPEAPSVWCYLNPKSWLSGAAVSGCCNCVDWCKDQLFGPEATYAEIERRLGETNDTPVFLPFLFGERCPGWQDERKGGFLGVTPSHTKYDLYQSVLEGVLFNLYQCYQVLTAINGAPKQIKLSGGIINSPFWSQMCADIFGMKMDVDEAAQGSLMGAAALAFEKLGVISDVSDFHTGAVKVIEPNKDMAGLYAEKYKRYLEYYRGEPLGK